MVPFLCSLLLLLLKWEKEGHNLGCMFRGDSWTFEKEEKEIESSTK